MLIDEIRELVEQWARVFQAEDCEDLSIRECAMHDAVLAWISEHLSAEWLCPFAAEGHQLLATFKQSEACLSMLEFPEDCVPPPVGVTLHNGFLLCQSQDVGKFVQGGVCPRRVVGLHEVVGVADWCSMIHTEAHRADRGLIVLSLRGISVASQIPPRPIRTKVFLGHRARSVIVQDALLVLIQLWAISVAFAVCVPALDADARHFCHRFEGLVCCL